MKSRLSILLTLASTLHAQDPNPFVKKGEAAKAEVPPGDSYVAVIEHITVPPDDVAAWIREHNLADGANDLRAVAQQWIGAGKACLEHTIISTGVAGRDAEISSIVELIYPTEYEPAGPGVWPLSASFETRNTGISAEIRPVTTNDGPRFSMWVDYTAYTGSRAWDALSDRTKHPTDIFMPEFRSLRATWGMSEDDPGDPFEPRDVHRDPPPSARTPAPLPQGKYQLLARIDPNPKARAAGGSTRLVFLRGEFTPPVKSAVPVSMPRHLAYELIEVPHEAFSTWQASKALDEIPLSAWSFVDGMRKAGDVTTISCGDGLANGSGKWTLENITEEIYPTEYVPSDRKTVLRRWEAPHRQQENGKSVEGRGTFETYKIEPFPGIAGAATATSFETRNTGMTVELKPFIDESGLWANLSGGYVARLGDTVTRRVEDGGEWIPDCTMPLFASNHFRSSCRLSPGKWTLVGSGSRFAGLATTDFSRCMLFFVKVE